MTRSLFRSATSVTGLAALLALGSCSDGGGSSKVASLDDAGGATVTTVAVDSQEAMLDYAQCMRDNGVEMQDPTFDADGSITGGGIGQGSGIDPRSSEFQTAQEQCGDLIEGIEFGGPGGGGGAFDRDAIQQAMTDFTACLRDEGLEVDDITFGGPGDGGGGPGGNGSIPVGAGGSVPPGGFDGGPTGSPPQGGPQGPGGEGFDPTARIIEQLGLDDTDPAVTAALDVCGSLLTDAFQPTATTSG